MGEIILDRYQELASLTEEWFEIDHEAMDFFIPTDEIGYGFGIVIKNRPVLIFDRPIWSGLVEKHRLSLKFENNEWCCEGVFGFRYYKGHDENLGVSVIKCVNNGRRGRHT